MIARTVRRVTPLVVLTTLSLAALPQVLAAQPVTVTCSSKPGERQHCPADTSGGIALQRSTGEAACLLGRTWGYDQASVWVSDGCSGEFVLGQTAPPSMATPAPAPPAKRIVTELRLRVIKGNRAEIGFLAERGGKLSGIDAVMGPEDLLTAAEHLSKTSGAVVAVSGPQDLIVLAKRKVIVENGHPMMARVTGLSCIFTGLIGAFAAVENDPLVVTVGAMAFFGLAGEQAALQAKGPGTFKTALLDILFSLTPEDMEQGIRLREEKRGG